MGQVRKQQASMTIIFSAMLCKLGQLQTCPIYKYQLHFYWHSWYQPRLAGIHNVMLSYTVKIQDTNSWLKVPISLSPGSNGFPWVYVWVDILLPGQVHPHIWLRKMKKKRSFYALFSPWIIWKTWNLTGINSNAWWRRHCMPTADFSFSFVLS